MNECMHSPEKVCDHCEPPLPAAGADKARDAVEAVLELARAWEVEYGSGSKAEQVLGKQKVSIDFAVGKIRAAIENALKP